MRNEINPKDLEFYKSLQCNFPPESFYLNSSNFQRNIYELYRGDEKNFSITSDEAILLRKKINEVFPQSRLNYLDDGHAHKFIVK